MRDKEEIKELYVRATVAQIIGLIKAIEMFTENDSLGKFVIELVAESYASHKKIAPSRNDPAA